MHSRDASGPDAALAPAAGAGRVAVARVDPAVTLPLRGRVLRAGAPPERARLSTDDHPEAAAFAATTVSGEVVSTAVVSPEPCPWRADEPGAWRLRGMATEPTWRRRGVGAQVLDAALAHVVDQGGSLVWCSARVPARRLYERAGFAAHGDVWSDPHHGPHVSMSRRVGPGSGPPPARH